MVVPFRLQLVRVLLSPHFLVRVDVEALRVSLEPYLGDDGASLPPVVHVVPVHVSEERVSLDAPGPPRDVAQPVGAVDGAELADDVFRFGREGGL